MIVVPEKLLSLPNVERIIDNGRSYILRKKLSSPTLNRESYVSKHAISVVLNGEQRINSFDGEMIVIRQNQLAFIPKGLYTVSDLMPQGGHFESILFYIEEEIVKDFQQDFIRKSSHQEKESDFFISDYDTSFASYLESFFDLIGALPASNPQLLPPKLNEILWLIHSMTSGNRFPEFLNSLQLTGRRNLKVFMETHFDKPLKIEDYAYLSGRSLSSFRRDFKAYFDLPPQQWLKQKRLEKAFQLLHNQDLNVSEVSLEVGYENTSYFIKAFKEKYAMTPKQVVIRGRMVG